jgi:xanthine dehydrogenase accessory factor
MDMIAQAVCDLLKKGETVVLATIVSHAGSTPRTSGSRMIITANGRGIGTIGGGLLEAEAMARAVELIRDGQSAIISFDLSHRIVDSMDMICGGQAEVLLDCLQPTATTIAAFDRWRRLLVKRQPGWLLTLITGPEGRIERTDHCLLTADGERIGDACLSDEMRDDILASADGISDLRTRLYGDRLMVVEPAITAYRVHLFGAGHVALSTCAMAATVGFEVVVADDRKAYANRQRFPDALALRVLEHFEQAFSGISVGRQDYIVIVTRGHLHDKIVLSQALQSDAGYIGMIGSRSKRDAIYTALLGDGFSQADIGRVHSPIGLSIGAETPEEIAVSIVAEMIRHRAGQRRDTKKGR